jgi:hypothetical protein
LYKRQYNEHITEKLFTSDFVITVCNLQSLDSQIKKLIKMESLFWFGLQKERVKILGM